MRKKKAIPAATRRAVALAAGCKPGETEFVAKCVYCGAEGVISWFPLSCGRPGAWVHFSGLELDHHFPESLGGNNSPANIRLACRRCNRSKGSSGRPRPGG